jgi:hypothetical protein
VWVHVSCYTTTWRTTTMTNMRMALLDLLRKDERKWIHSFFATGCGRWSASGQTPASALAPRPPLLELKARFRPSNGWYRVDSA